VVAEKTAKKMLGATFVCRVQSVFDQSLHAPLASIKNSKALSVGPCGSDGQQLTISS